jgi:hypothetical protein
MKSIKSITGIASLCAAVVAVALLCSCGNSDEEAAAAAKQAAARKVVKKVVVNDPLAGMSSAVTGSKGNLPVDVHFELMTTPEISKPMTIRLAFVPTVDLFAIQAAVKSPSAGISVADNSQIKFEAPKNGEVKEYSFSATPASSGIQLVQVELTITRDTGDTVFNYTLPVPVPETGAGLVSAADSH